MVLKDLKSFHALLEHWIYLSNGLGEPVVISVDFQNETIDIIVIEGRIYTLSLLYQYLLHFFYKTQIDLSDKISSEYRKISDESKLKSADLYYALLNVLTARNCNPISYVENLENYIEKSRMNPIEIKGE